MKRYSMEIDTNTRTTIIPFEDENGEWVKYDDHLFELVAALEKKMCKWVERSCWDETECNHLVFCRDIAGDIPDFTFCPYCGGKIEVVE